MLIYVFLSFLVLIILLIEYSVSSLSFWQLTCTLMFLLILLNSLWLFFVYYELLVFPLLVMLLLTLTFLSLSVVLIWSIFILLSVSYGLTFLLLVVLTLVWVSLVFASELIFKWLVALGSIFHCSLALLLLALSWLSLSFYLSLFLAFVLIQVVHGYAALVLFYVLGSCYDALVVKSLVLFSAFNLSSHWLWFLVIVVLFYFAFPLMVTFLIEFLLLALLVNWLLVSILLVVIMVNFIFLFLFLKLCYWYHVYPNASSWSLVWDLSVDGLVFGWVLLLSVLVLVTVVFSLFLVQLLC